MIPRLLNWQGIAGIGVAVALFVMLTVQKLEAVHWRKQSEKFEQLYEQEQAAFATTVANTRAAASEAEADDKANADRVASQQRTINERTASEFESRLAAARAELERLRIKPKATADSGVGASAHVSSVSVAAGGTAQGSGEDQFSQGDRLTATEQAIQLDELIKWVRLQHAVASNGSKK